MIGLAASLPFVGFGFLDNALMIIFGEMIDGTLCVMMGFSTMAAAAIGNTISDVAGIFSGGAVEEIAARCGVEEPPLTREQRQHPSAKKWQYSGQVIGIVIGCTLGCCPLLWMDPHAAERLKHEREQEKVFQGVVDKLCHMLHAEAVGLLLVDKERHEIYSKNITDKLCHFRWAMTEGFMGHVATTGHFVNIADVADEPLYDPKVHDNLFGTGMKVQSLICMPVFRQGEVSALIIVYNKMGETVFTARDEDVLSAVCTHVAAAMTDDRHNFEEVLDNCEKSMTLQSSPQWNTTAKERRKTLFTPVLRGMDALLDAESTALLLLDDEHGEVYTEAGEGTLPKYRSKLGEGFAGQAVERGKVVSYDSKELSELDPAQTHDYHGSGIIVRSVLCVPIFDTSRKCLGAIECINKTTATAFTHEDEQYVSQVANYIALMLEGPTAELRRVLALTRQQMQRKAAMAGTHLDEDTVVCFLERAQDLPSGETGIDPYVTVSIVRGNPLEQQDRTLKERVLRQRLKGTHDHVRAIGKSSTLIKDPHPKWDEAIPVVVPPKLRRVPISELFLHVLVWDYDTWRQDNLVGQAAFPVAEIPRTVARGARPFHLLPVPGQEGAYDLAKARIWLAFSRGGG